MSATLVAEPIYTDRTHPIYRALPIAEALGRLSARYEATLIEDFALGEINMIEPVLNDCGDAAGGSSIYGYRHDLLLHVQTASDDAERPYQASWDAAKQWLIDVDAVLKLRGMTFAGGEIVAVRRVGVLEMTA